MVKVTKQSSNKGKRKAQSYSTLRFSATKGFDSSQAKITQAFKRVDKSNATAAVVDPPNSSDQGEPSINSNQGECSDQNMAYNQPSGVSISRTDVISTIQEETPNININTSAMENISTQDMEVVEEESLVLEEPEEDAEYQKAEDNDVIEDLPVNSKHKAFFESIHARLRNNGCPVEYDRKTFWVEPVNAYFAMKNKIDPSESLYQPRVFLWLPHHLLPFKFQSLRCPKCKASVKGKGFNKDPHARRIVDLTSCFYLMSYRYECSVTGCKKEGFEDSWQSYDPVIMHQLPQELQMEFPAILTRKGGVSKTVANLLRPCMQNSMGPQRFQKLLRELHVLRHDELELQYLLSQLGKKEGLLEKYPFRPYSSFEDSNQYAGYVPGAIYFRTLYTAIIDELKPKMEKHAMLLDGKVLKCDHSFKFPKHIAKIEDAGVFTALFTVTNEYEEIVHQVLVPSKFLIYLKHSLQKMKEAYELYGHQMPVAFFNDNVQSDKRFLEGIFESLKVTQEEARQQETTSVSASPSFLRQPDDVQMEYINRNVGLIFEKMKDLYDKLAVERNAGKPSVIGLDTEWNDSEDPRHDQVDVIQIAHGNTVSVIHIDKSWSTLLKELVDVLVNVDITKVGRSVGVDFSRLNNRFGIECKTKLELGSFCSARQLISNGTMSLSDISLSVLGAPQDKGPQRSPWNMDDLSPDLLNYAAIDAWAGLAIYNVAVNYQPVGTRVSPTSPVGSFVDVKPPRNSQAVAHGEIIVNDSTATVKITKVNVPGYLANGVALQAYGAPPFELKVPVAHLVTALPPSEVSSSSPVNPAATYNPLVATPVSNPNTILESEIQTKMQEIFGDALDRVDKAGFINGYRKFAWYNADPNIAFTRVVKDIFHLMDMIKPYKRHTLYKQFTRKFSDSLFTIDQSDKEKVVEALEKEKRENPLFTHTWDSKMKYDRAWLWKRVRRKVSAPEMLLPLLKSLFLSYGPLKCVKSGRALFDKKSWEQAAAVLRTVELGHVSDPPDVQLYIKTGKLDNLKLTLYRCVRRTNSLEGGVHQNLIRKFGSFGAGPELANAMLTEYRLRHNIDVGSKNRHSVIYKGHYNPWLVQHIDLLRQKMGFDADTNNIALSVNALEYCGSGELFGICPLPNEEMAKIGILPSLITDLSLPLVDKTIPHLQDTVFMKVGSTLRSKLGRYQFVAKNQCTMFAVLAVHTMQEKFEFRGIYENYYKNTGNNGRRINFVDFAIKFNLKANGIDIFYKTVDHLEKYYKDFEIQDGVSRTEMMHANALRLIESQVASTNQPSQLLPAASPKIPSINNASAVVPAATIDAQISPPPTSLQMHQLQQQQYQLQQQHHLQQNALLAGYPIQLPLPIPSHNPQTVLLPPTNRFISPRPQMYQTHPYQKGPLITKRATARSCKGCGSGTCNGRNKRAECNSPRCLKCASTSGYPGIWDAKNCNK